MVAGREDTGDGWRTRGQVCARRARNGDSSWTSRKGIMASGLLAISVLIPTHNRADIIRCTRESLREAKTLAGTAVKM